MRLGGTIAACVLTLALIGALFFAIASNYASAASIPPAFLAGRVLAGSTPIKEATVTLFAVVDHQRAILDFASSEPVAESHTDGGGRFSIDLSKAHATVITTRGRSGPLVRVEVTPQPGTFYLVCSSDLRSEQFFIHPQRVLEAAWQRG